MATGNCSSSFLLDPYLPPGRHWAPSADQLLAFETEALARVLGASMSPDRAGSALAAADTTPSSSSRSSAFLIPCSSPPPSTAATPTSHPAGSPFSPSSQTAFSPSSHPASSSPAAPHPRPLQPGAGRVSKRRARRAPPPSKRAAITFIDAEPARFRDLVEQWTGIGAASAAPPPQPGMAAAMMTAGPAPGPAPAQFQPLTPAAMPTLNVSAGFVDAAAVPQQQRQILSAPWVLLDNSYPPLFPGFDFADELLNTIPDLSQQPQPQPLPPCFPTLESWSD